MASKVEICGVNTSKLPTLTKQEKDELFIKIKAGDKEAREKFVQGNLRLVLSVIQRFGNRGENADDLFQVGCIGLIKAIDNFDLSQNVQFSTYAVPMNVLSRKLYSKFYFYYFIYNDNLANKCPNKSLLFLLRLLHMDLRNALFFIYRNALNACLQISRAL